MLEVRAGGSAPEETADALVVGVGADRAFDPVGHWLLEQMPWLERSLDKEESMIFVSEFSRDVWKSHR